MAVQLRLAEVSDAVAIAMLSKAQIEYGLPWSWKPARVRSAIHDADTNVLVAVEGGAVLGFGIMVYRDETAHLCLFAVQAHGRRRGLGSAMLTWLEGVARVAGIESLSLEARADNTIALSFYRKHGYQQTALVAGMYEGIQDGVRLEKRLFTRRTAGVQ